RADVAVRVGWPSGSVVDEVEAVEARGRRRGRGERTRTEAGADRSPLAIEWRRLRGQLGLWPLARLRVIPGGFLQVAAARVCPLEPYRRRLTVDGRRGAHRAGAICGTRARTHRDGEGDSKSRGDLHFRAHTDLLYSFSQGRSTSRVLRIIRA